MSARPKGWFEVELGETVLPLETCDPTKEGDAIFQYVDIGSIDNKTYSIETTKKLLGREAPSRARRRIRRGDVLFSTVRTYLKNIAVVPEELDGAVTSTGIAVLRPSRAILSDFLFAMVRSEGFIRTLSLKQDGTLYPAITDGDLLNHQIALPPLAEQRRIVAKLGALNAKSARVRTEIARIDTLVSRYKEAVLNSAFSGELTRVWRMRTTDQLPGPSDQSHLNLDDGERGLWFSTNLPVQWEWRGFSEVFIDLTDSKRKLPQKDYLSEGRYPVVDQGAAKIGGYTDLSELLHPADAPFIVFGDHTRCVKYIERRFVQGADGVKVFHAAPDILLSFAYFALSAVELPNKGYARHMKFVRSTVFPVAPILEQHEIVRRIESAFAKIDGLAGRTKRALELVGRLEEAVLAKAFRGELLPQNENDEPANILLARIKQTRINQPAETKSKTPKRQAKAPDMARTIVDALVQAKDWLTAQELFERCGVRDGSSTEDVENLYRQLLELERQERIEIEEVVDFTTGAKQGDRIRLRK